MSLSFNSDTLLNLYNTLVYPYVNYCIKIWGNAAKLHIEKIHILQNKIIRIISGVPRKTHSNPLFEKLKVLTIYQAYNYSIDVFMYKLFHFLIPPFLLCSNAHQISMIILPDKKIPSIYNLYQPKDHKKQLKYLGLNFGIH